MSDNKRLLILIWNLGIGGVQKRMRDVSKEISLNYPDWEVYFLVKTKEPRCFNDEINKLDRVSITYFDWKKTSAGKTFFSVEWLTREYLKIRPDVCLTFMSHLAFTMLSLKYFAFWHKSKMVINEGIVTSDYLPIHSPKPSLEKLVIRLLYPLADLVISPTEVAKKDLVSNFSVPPTKITHIPNWTLFPPINTKKKEYDLLFVGRFEEEKSPMVLLNIIRKVKKDFPKIKACFLGEGSLKSKMQKYIKDNCLQNNITILKTTNNPTHIFQSSRLLILNSKNEGLPNVVLEAAMCRVPTITNAFPGVTEVVNHGKTGFIAQKPQQFHACIKELLRDKTKQETFGLAAQQHVQHTFGTNTQDLFIRTLLTV